MQDLVAALLERLADGELSAVSMRELTRRAGVGRATLWPLLGGELRPRVDTLMRVAQAARISIGVL